MNKAREICLRQGYDFLFNVEHDIILPKDALQKLLKYAKHDNCVSGVYRQRPLRHKETPICCKTKDNKWPKWEDIKDKETVPLWIIPFGCLLIGRKVLEKVEFDQAIDGSFANKTEQLGIEKLLVTSVICGHIERDGKVLWP